MVQKPINANDKRILSALNAGITKRKELVKVTKFSEMQVRRSLEKLINSNYRLVKRIRKGHFELTEEGRKKEGKEQAKSDKMLHIGEDFSGKISSYIKNKVPMGFQSVMRLILCEMHSRESPEIFNNPAHSGAYSSIILAGDPKTMKSPVIEAICKMTGLNFEEHKFVVGATRRETIGGWENLPGKGQTFIPSPWVNKKIIILDDFGDIINRKDTREGVLILAHGDRSFRRGEQIIPQHCVPFVTFNTRTETISKNIEEIEKVVGTEYVKRGIVVSVNSFAASLEDSPILTRKMLKSVPRLNLDAFPIKKKELTDKEFEFMYNILKKATLPKRRKLFDERSIGKRVLSRYALSKNENIIDSIFQTCIDELERLQTLNITVEGWRSELIKDWKEARPDNVKLKKIWEEEEQRTKESKQKEAEEQKKRLEELEREKDTKLNEEAAFNAEYKKELDKVKKLLLDSKGIPDFINRRSSLNKEYQNFKKGNLREKFNQLKRRVLYWEEEVKPYKIKYEEDQERIEEEKQERESIIKELSNLKSDLYSLTGCDSEGRLWRNRTDKLRLEIKEVIDQNKRLSLDDLRLFLAETRLKKEKIFFSKEIEELKKRLIPFAENHEQEAIRKIEYLDKWLVWIENRNDLKSIEEAREENLPNIKKGVDEVLFFLVEKIEKDSSDEISSQEEKKREMKEKEEESKEGRKKEQGVLKELKALQDKKNALEQRAEQGIFESKYLSSPEKAELDILQNYQKRKKAPVSNITSFLKEKKLVNQVNSFLTCLPSGQSISNAFNNSYFKRFSDFVPLEVYWAVDGQLYPLNHFTSWDRAKALIQTRIDQLRNKAITERRTELLREVAPLEEKENSLKPPFFYISNFTTDGSLVRASYLGKKDDGRELFKFEDGIEWWLPKTKRWTVYTKKEYGGEVFPFISAKKSTIVVQTNKGEREISKDQVFCYTYKFIRSEPT